MSSGNYSFCYFQIILSLDFASFINHYPNQWVSLIAQSVKNPPAMQDSACNAGDPGLIPWSGRSLEKKMANHSSILAWKIPGGLQSMGLQESVRHDLAAKPPLPPTSMLTSIEPRT